MQDCVESEMSEIRPIDRVKARMIAGFSTWSREMTMDDMRRGFEDMLSSEFPSIDTPVTINGMDAVWIDAGAESQKTVLYFHGGGYQMGSIKSHHGLMARISAAAGMRVLAFDYRLAPEHRFPAAHDDSFAVYKWLLDQGVAANDIAFAGDSAGAGLAVSTLMRARDAGLALPATAVLLSPWLDMEMQGESYVSRAAVDPMTQREKMVMMVRTYLGRGGNTHDPMASPIYGDLSGLPPMLIHVGDHETVLDDSRDFAALAQDAGTTVDVVIWDNMIHHFQVFPELEETQTSLDQIGAYLRGALD